MIHRLLMIELPRVLPPKHGHCRGLAACVGMVLGNGTAEGVVGRVSLRMWGVCVCAREK